MSAKSKSLKPRQLQEAVMDYVGRQKNNTYNYKQVSHAIGVDTPAAQRAVALFLAELAFDGIIIEVAPGKFKSPARTVVATGVFSRRSNGTNSVITDEDGEQIFVAERNSMHALNGDRVAIEVAARVPGKDPEAVVTKILEKNEQTFIGTLKVDKHFAYLLTDSKFLATDIFIPKAKLRGGQTGDKAVVKITEWPDDAKNPRGEVIDVLGAAGENDTEINAIM
ncbi:MAG: ribonuclease R, partial [Muribaculaceae bacterium]|nr:ribonuclease R [Muribaculaceae bacterium]